MARQFDNLYEIVYAAQDLANNESGHDELVSLIDDEIAPWLSAWATWEDGGRRPGLRPNNEYRERPTLKYLKEELAYIGYECRGGKNPKVWRI